MNLDFLLAFSGGLLGGFGHCLGMCGPIVAATALQPGETSPARRISGQLLYNLGRITTYALLGALLGLLGTFANLAGGLAGFQNIVLFAAGILMILMGLGVVGPLRIFAPFEKKNFALLALAGRFLKLESPLRFYPLGLVLGLLPCGLSYSYLFGAAGSGSALKGMLFMVAFGAGTVPGMLFFASIITVMRGKIRGVILRLAGVLIILTGMLFLFRGWKLYGAL